MAEGSWLSLCVCVHVPEEREGQRRGRKEPQDLHMENKVYYIICMLVYRKLRLGKPKHSK